MLTGHTQNFDTLDLAGALNQSVLAPVMNWKNTFKWALITVISGIFVESYVGALPASATEILARCNYDFNIKPNTYDRGTVVVTKSSMGLHMQFVQDDVITPFDKVQPSTASGDQARDLIKKDKNFGEFATQARITPEQVVRLDGFVVPGEGLFASPQARLFIFYGADQRQLGGFGMLGKSPFLCDWN